MSDPQLRDVLFLCTGNSARSIMAEALLRRWGADRFRAHSAGSRPRGVIHPMALRILEEFELPVEGLRSKSWEEFAGFGARPMDFVITLCDAAVAETCPTWPGQPIRAHWDVGDPANFVGPEALALHRFRIAFRKLEIKVKTFCTLQFGALGRLALERQMVSIGRLQAEPPVQP